MEGRVHGRCVVVRDQSDRPRRDGRRTGCRGLPPGPVIMKYRRDVLCLDGTIARRCRVMTGGALMTARTTPSENSVGPSLPAGIVTARRSCRHILNLLPRPLRWPRPEVAVERVLGQSLPQVRRDRRRARWTARSAASAWADGRRARARIVEEDSRRCRSGRSSVSTAATGQPADDRARVRARLPAVGCAKRYELASAGGRRECGASLHRLPSWACDMPTCNS